MLAQGWLAQQPPAFASAFLARTHLVGIAAGAVVFHAGDDPGGVYGVVAGGIGSYVVWRDNGPDLATILRAGVWFGHGPLLTRRRRSLGFRAVEPSILLHAPLAALEELVCTNPVAARSLGALADGNMDVAIATISDLLIRRGDRRIAATLLRVTGEGQGPEDPAGFRLSQADLAEMANTSRDLANRTLARFRDRGWVTLGYNRIGVADAAALATFAAERD